MAGVNKVILVGNLGKDPEVRRLESGVSVANFPVATSESYLDRTTNERKTITEWHNVVVWRGLAEVAEKYLTKGKQIYLEGKLRTRSWEDQDKNMRYTTEVVANNFVMLGNKDENGSNSSPNGGQNFSKSSQSSSPAQEAQTPNLNQSSSDADDDLPF